MNKISSSFSLSFSDLLINLSAGWFGAVLILPGVWESYDLRVNFTILLFDLFYGVLCFSGAVYLRNLKK